MLGLIFPTAPTAYKRFDSCGAANVVGPWHISHNFPTNVLRASGPQRAQRMGRGDSERLTGAFFLHGRSIECGLCAMAAATAAGSVNYLHLSALHDRLSAVRSPGMSDPELTATHSPAPGSASRRPGFFAFC